MRKILTLLMFLVTLSAVAQNPKPIPYNADFLGYIRVNSLETPLSSPAGAQLAVYCDTTTGQLYTVRSGGGTDTSEMWQIDLNHLSTPGNIGSSNGVSVRIMTDSINRMYFGADANGRIGLNNASTGATTGPSYNVSFSNGPAVTIGIEAATLASGSDLNLIAGNAKSGGTDIAGGDLVLKGASSTGTGTSQIEFYTATAGSTGTSYNTPDLKLTLRGDGGLVGTTIRSYASDALSNSFLGKDAGVNTSTNTWCAGVGHKTQYYNSDKSYITTLGAYTLNANTWGTCGERIIAIGTLTGSQGNYMQNSILIGDNVGYQCTKADNVNISGMRFGYADHYMSDFTFVGGQQSCNNSSLDTLGNSIIIGNGQSWTQLTGKCENNILIGKNYTSAGAKSNRLFIDISQTDTPLIDGDFSTDKVTINSILKLTPTSEPGSPVEGDIYANSSDHHLYFYNGSTWKQLDN